MKAIAAFWILGVLGYLLIPVARRLTGAHSADAPRKVDLAAGVEVGRSRVRFADGSRAGRESLYVVVAGRVRIGDLELRPGEAALVPPGAAPNLDADSRVVTVDAR